MRVLFFSASLNKLTKSQQGSCLCSLSALKHQSAPQRDLACLYHLFICSYAQCVSIPWCVGQSTGCPLSKDSSSSLYCSSTRSCCSWPLLPVRKDEAGLRGLQMWTTQMSTAAKQLLASAVETGAFQRDVLLHTDTLSSGVDALQAVVLCLDLALITIKQRPQKVSGATNIVIAAWWWYWWCRGKCQDFDRHFPSNGAISDREQYIYPEFGLPCYSGSFLDKAHLMPSLPAGKDSLLHTVVLCHPDLIYINNAFLKGFRLLVLWRYQVLVYRLSEAWQRRRADYSPQSCL